MAQGDESPDPARRIPDTATPRRVGLFLVPGFALIPFSSAVEAMRAANRMSDRALYAWTLLSADGAPVSGASGVEVGVDGNLETALPLDDLLVIASNGAERYVERRVFAWLRRLARGGCRVGAASLGSYLLARAGLLEGFRCTLHWENLAGFREAFPDLEVTSEVFEIDRGRFTCSGGTAALDMMLSMIAEAHGRELAIKVAEQFIHGRIRDSHDHQRMTLQSRLGVSQPTLLAAVDLMEQSLDDVMTRAELARRVGVSPRKLERLFRRYLDCTPTRFYLTLRLERARHMLLQTTLSILEVALACGFVSPSHFSKTYREHFGRTPREERSAPGQARA